MEGARQKKSSAANYSSTAEAGINLPAASISRSIHLGETRYYITADVHATVFTSAIIQYYRMQWPTTVLVFPPFPTLL
jgi:hypothetical protein